MNTKYLSHIRCIHCQGGLDSISAGEVIENGLIECRECGAQFPVIRFIPRMFGGDLMVECLAFYDETVRSVPALLEYSKTTLSDRPVVAPQKAERLKSRTQKTFSYEWKVWSRLPDFAENHFLEVMRVEEAFFRGKTGWDPAIGMGRDLSNAIKAVGVDGFMIGSDLSYAVDIAYDRCKDYPNYLIVQADLYSGFVPDGSLDFAYMIGLIQHLTDPKQGIEKVYKKLRTGGYFVGTVYEKPKSILTKALVAVIRFMRMFTTHLPLPLVLWISRLFALPAYLFFKLPRSILSKSEYVQEVSDQYPTHETEKGKPSYDLLVHNWFDHFTPPIIGFFSDEEVLALLSDVRLDGLELKYGIFRGFRA